MTIYVVRNSDHTVRIHFATQQAAEKCRSTCGTPNLIIDTFTVFGLEGAPIKSFHEPKCPSAGTLRPYLGYPPVLPGAGTPSSLPQFTVTCGDAEASL